MLNDFGHPEQLYKAPDLKDWCQESELLPEEKAFLQIRCAKWGACLPFGAHAWANFCRHQAM